MKKRWRVSHRPCFRGEELPQASLTLLVACGRAGLSRKEPAPSQPLDLKVMVPERVARGLQGRGTPGRGQGGSSPFVSLTFSFAALRLRPAGLQTEEEPSGWPRARTPRQHALQAPTEGPGCPSG